MNILIVGSMNTIFLHSYKEIFQEMGHNVFTGNCSKTVAGDVNDNNNFNFYSNTDNDNGSSFFRRLAARFKLDDKNFFWKLVEEKEYKSRLSRDKVEQLSSFLLEKNIDLVFCFWGTTLKKEVFALKQIKIQQELSFKLVLSVNTYPVRYVLPKKLNKKSLKFLRRDLEYFNSFEQLICPTTKMAQVFKEGLSVRSDIIVKPDFLSHNFFSRSNSNDRIRNSVVFLGNVDFDKRRLDDISQIIISIANKGIDVWIQSPCTIEHPHVHTFTPFTYSEIAKGMLGHFVSKFTASIVIYNNYNNLRTSLGYPTRFALATLGGGYILLPKGTFDGVEDYMSQHAPDAIRVFDDIDQISSIVTELDNLPKPDFSNLFSYLPGDEINNFLSAD